MSYRKLTLFLSIALLLFACQRAEPPKGAVSGTLVFPGDIGGPTATAADGLVSHALGGVGRGLEVVPGEVVVQFADNVLRSQTTLSVAGVSLTLARSVADGKLSLYRAPELSQEQTLALVRALRARPDVVDAFPNWILHALAPNDEFYPFQWHYEAFNLPAAWDIEDGTTRVVTVAVVDTGIAPHPDLTAVLPGYDFVDRNSDPTDPGGQTGYHGLHVAGTIAAATNNGVGIAGVNWGAQIVPVRVLGANGSGRSTDIIDGIIWAAGNPQNEPGLPPNPNPAAVINLSLGGNIGEPCPQTLNALFGELAASGAILVAAAGNENVNAATTFPANCSNVITVGATGPQNTRAPYSNFGSVIDVMAPGGDTSQTLTVLGRTVVAGVLSTILGDDEDPVYGFYQGTSMAAPHISGLVALMLAREPNLTLAQIKTRLQNAATPLTASACNRPSGNECGAGLVNAAVALGGGGTTPPPPPPPPTSQVPTYVVAFYCVAFGGNPCADFDLDRSVEAVVPTTATQVPYTITGLTPGDYRLAAWQDINQNLIVDDNEPFGVNPNIITVRPSQTQTGVTIFLEPYKPLGAMAQQLEQLREGIEQLRRR
jgi:serine protease